MLLRVIEILFPMFSLVALGFLCAKQTNINMKPINRVNIDYFAPALVFSSLVNMPLGFRQLDLIYACLIAIIVPGILLGAFCYVYKWPARVWVPPHMFRNSGNLAIPLFVYTFGQSTMGDAVLLMVVSTCLQVSLGLFIISGGNREGLKQLLKMPIIYATFGALAINLLGIELWKPLLQATELLGASNIPLMLFSLGTQLIYLQKNGLKIGLATTVSSIATGGVSFLVIQWLIPLPVIEQQMMVLFTMLPPAVMNYLLAERYEADGSKVASMVLYGNFFAIFTMPLILTLAFAIT